MRYSEGLAMPGVSKANEGSCIVYITEKLAHQYA